MNPLNWSTRMLIAVRAALTFVLLCAMLPPAFAAVVTASAGWQLVFDSVVTSKPSQAACIADGNASNNKSPPARQRTWYCREKFVTKMVADPTPTPVPTPTPTPTPTPSPTGGLCRYPDGFTFKVGPDGAKNPTEAKPATGVCYTDPVYGTQIVRTAGGMRNDYSRRQAFNSDNTLFLAFKYSSGDWYVYDAKTYAQKYYIGNAVGDQGEPQWDPVSPTKLKYFSNMGQGGKLFELDVTTGKSTQLADIKSKLPTGFANSAIWTKAEGSPSRDHRYWCLMAENSSWVTKQVFVFDLQTQTVLGSTAAPEDPDHVSMSPSGRWCVASYDGKPGVVAYSRDNFAVQKKLSSHGEHSDIAVGADGHDVYVSINYDSDADVPSGHVYAHDIDAGVKTPLFSSYDNGHATAFHFSGKAFDKAGWVLIGAVEPSGPFMWMDNKLFALELATKRIVMLANHRSVRNDYQDEPHASVSRDFSRVAFTSNWGSGTATDDYIIELPGGIR